eukprot:m.157469 g.157469  ORF g.157469 m.157469 type:complete len:193 (-) comp13349_c0_seq2:2622-3200(-)
MQVEEGDGVTEMIERSSMSTTSILANRSRNNSNNNDDKDGGAKDESNDEGRSFQPRKILQLRDSTENEESYVDVFTEDTDNSAIIHSEEEGKEEDNKEEEKEETAKNEHENLEDHVNGVVAISNEYDGEEVLVDCDEDKVPLTNGTDKKQTEQPSNKRIVENGNGEEGESEGDKDSDEGEGATLDSVSIAAV